MRDNAVNYKHAHVIWLRLCCKLRWLHMVICGWHIVGMVCFFKLFGLVRVSGLGKESFVGYSLSNYSSFIGRTMSCVSWAVRGAGGDMTRVCDII